MKSLQFSFIARRWLGAVVLLALLVTVHVAQTSGQIEVIRNVNLRVDPNTLNDPIRLLSPPLRLALIEVAKQNGYYHVRADDGTTGWVWARNVVLLPEGDSSSGTVTTPAPPLWIAQHISPSWQKFVPSETVFTGTEGTCGPEGNGTDAAQFILKNRSDVPPFYYDVTFDAIDELPFPGRGSPKAPKNRRNWLPEHFAITNPYERIPVRVEGYLLVVRDQKKSQPGKGEGTNCGFGKLGNIDAHLALVENFGDLEPKAIVVEWTPRFTQLHPNWTSKKIKPWINTGVKVRISGWLMVDPNHFDHIGKYRNTLWEIHPITEIELFLNGNYVALDAMP